MDLTGVLRFFLAPVVLVAIWLAPQTAASEEGIRTLLAARSHPEIADQDWARWRDVVAAAYVEREFEPLWFKGGSPSAAALALLGELRNADQRGLVPRDYSGERLARALEERSHVSRNEPTLAKLDIALSVMAARFSSELHSGRIDSRTLGFSLDAARPPLDVIAMLRSLSAYPDGESTADFFDSIEPRWRRFELLKQALAHYRSLADEAWQTNLARPPRSGASLGDSYAGAPDLRRLLTALGDLTDDTGGTDSTERLDPVLVAALQRFQRRHGLQPSGDLDDKTYRALSVPFELRVRQIELTLERFRWLPPKLDTAPIVVNIPQFKLFAFYTTEDREEDILSIDVIVGRAFARYSTPVFTADMTHLVFNPFWDVPRSILINEFLPLIRVNPDWVRNKGYEVVQNDGNVSQDVDAAILAALANGTARLRQRPGRENALGRVKFVLPNRYNVQLHDTPAASLFSEASRAFSHGCVRVADPVSLAEYVLRDNPDWNRDGVLAAMQDERPLRVDLVRPIRVYILYATTIVAEDGTVYFFEDVYGHDARLDDALKARLTP